MTSHIGAPVLVDRELELDVVGVAFLASFRLNAGEDEAARHALAVVRDLDPLLFGCRDVRHLLVAVQQCTREHGVAAPALVRDLLRQRRAWDELRYTLPTVVGGAAGVVAAIDGYHERLVELARRRAGYLRATREAADLLMGS